MTIECLIHSIGRYYYEPCRSCDGYNPGCDNYLAKHIRANNRQHKTFSTPRPLEDGKTMRNTSLNKDKTAGAYSLTTIYQIRRANDSSVI